MPRLVTITQTPINIYFTLWRFGRKEQLGRCQLQRNTFELLAGPHQLHLQDAAGPSITLDVDMCPTRLDDEEQGALCAAV